MSETPHCIHFIVSGRVQGVCFRNATQQQALSRGLTGWVKNLNDGRVEGVVSGDRAAVTEFCAWLKQGPPLAKVDQLKQEEISYQRFDDFIIIKE